MPVYCYTSEDRKAAVERVYPVGRAPRRIRVNGRVLHRDIAAEHVGHVNTPGNWPMLSDGMGVHPQQIPEFERGLRKAGIPTEFTADGRAKLNSARHRAEVGRWMGLYDRNAGYSDPAPVHG